MFLSNLKTKLVLVATIGMLAGSAHAQSLEVDLSVAPSAEDLKAAQSPDSLDEDTFFSGGVKSTIRQTAVASEVSRPSIDVHAVCSAVVGEGPANYTAQFFKGCETVVRHHATRQARR